MSVFCSSAWKLQSRLSLGDYREEGLEPLPSVGKPSLHCMHLHTLPHVSALHPQSEARGFVSSEQLVSSFVYRGGQVSVECIEEGVRILAVS